MTRDELRERVLAHFEACGPDSDAAADGAIAIVGEACAEIVITDDEADKLESDNEHTLRGELMARKDAIRALTSEKPNA